MMEDERDDYSSDLEQTLQVLEKESPFSCSSSSPLENDTDIMTASNCLCCNPRHYHSFREVSVLWPSLHPCAICHELLSTLTPPSLFVSWRRSSSRRVSVPSSSHVVVQCMACQLMAHRTCALSDTAKWNQRCRINYEQFEKELSSGSSMNDREAGRNPQENSSRTVAREHEEFDETDSPLVIDGEETKKDRNVPSCLFPVNPSSASSSSLEPPTAAAVMKEEAGPATTTATRLPLFVSKEGTIGRSSTIDGLPEKIYPPYFSASKKRFFDLAASWKELILDTVADEIPNDPMSDVTSETSTASSPPPPDASSQSSIDAVECTSLQETLPQLEEHEPTIRDGDDTLSGGSDQKNEVKEITGTLEWTTEGPPVHWATGKLLSTLLPSRTELENDAVTIASTASTSSSSYDATESEEPTTSMDPLHIRTVTSASVSRSLQENILAQFQPVAMRRILFQDEETKIFNPVQDEREEEISTSIKTSALAEVHNTHVEVDTKHLLKPADTHGANIRRLGLATVAGGIAGGVVGMAIAGPMGCVLGAKLAQGCVLGVKLVQTASIPKQGEQQQQQHQQPSSIATSEVGRMMVHPQENSSSTIYSEHEKELYETGRPLVNDGEETMIDTKVPPDLPQRNPDSSSPTSLLEPAAGAGAGAGAAVVLKEEAGPATTTATVLPSSVSEEGASSRNSTIDEPSEQIYPPYFSASKKRFFDLAASWKELILDTVADEIPNDPITDVTSETSTASSPPPPDASSQSSIDAVECTSLQETLPQLEEHEPTIRDGDDTLSGGSDQKNEVKEITGTLEWTTEGPPVHWATGKSLSTLLPSRTELENDAVTIASTASTTSSNYDATESEEPTTSMDPLHIRTVTSASVSRSLQENILAQLQPVAMRRILFQDEETKIFNPVQDEREEEISTSIKTSALDDVHDTHVEPPPTVVDTKHLLKPADTHGANIRRLGLATVAGGIAGGVVGMAIAGPMGCVLGAKLAQGCVLGVKLVQTARSIPKQGEQQQQQQQQHQQPSSIATSEVGRMMVHPQENSSSTVYGEHEEEFNETGCPLVNDGEETMIDTKVPPDLPQRNPDSSSPTSLLEPAAAAVVLKEEAGPATTTATVLPSSVSEEGASSRNSTIDEPSEQIYPPYFSASKKRFFDLAASWKELILDTVADEIPNDPISDVTPETSTVSSPPPPDASSQSSIDAVECTSLQETLPQLEGHESTMRDAHETLSRGSTMKTDTETINGTLEWTREGPPVHWATGKSLGTLLPSRAELENDAITTTSTTGTSNDATESEEPTSSMDPLHMLTIPFASVSRTLHQNILAHFRPIMERLLVQEEEAKKINPVHDECKKDMDDSIETSASENVEPVVETEDLLKEAEVPSANKRRLGLATVAGGIAGGVVGMVVAGPVGCVIGAKLVQTAGILGVVLEGSWTIGVITGGIVAGRNAGQQFQDKLDEKRVLALRGTGANQGVLLVRPSVRADPAWAIFCEQAKRSHKKPLAFNFLATDSEAAHRERYQREIDIVNTDEHEITTADKVLLLVSRMLNDKDGLPGHVYRQLIEKFNERVASRGELSEIISAADSAESAKDPDECEMEEEYWMGNIRARRQDAHSVIKYVTATLLELRPGFATSPSITEDTATAVEALVFGEIYDMVIEEIEAEFEQSENELLEKVANFERQHAQHEGGLLKYKGCVSEDALASLRHLPQAHSAVDKLRYCVMFLERIAVFFSNDSRQKPMGADSLLKLVCQHIIVAKVFGINAQIAFLEEFARDEQLLRGKEGYALVTLQASLHFLNASSDFDRDIFDQEDD